MSEFGLKIKNIKAGTLFGYNQGVRNRYDFTEAMFSNSLFSDYIIQNGLNVWNDTSTRDIICLDFDFGSRSYEEEMDHLLKQFGPYEHDKDLSEESKERIRAIFRNVIDNKDNYMKCSKDEIREIFYENGVNVEYTNPFAKKNEDNKQIINYRMLYRNSSKAKIGQVMFINSKLYKKAYNWLTMGLGEKMPMDNAKIVEMSAYAPLTTSTIVGKFYCPVEAILIIKDTDSFYKTIAKIVKAEDYVVQEKVLDETATEIAKQRAIREGKFLKDGVTPKYTKRYKRVNVTKKKCVVHDEETEVKNTLWDGEMLIESDILPGWVNGMALLRQHFFKACGIRTHIQLFFKDWCEKTGHDYETYAVQDMFGVWHKLKDIRMITTDNAIKWKKFMNLMGDTPAEAYQYWCDRVNETGSYWGIVKTDHPSKLGNVQQMSYQMVNTLPSYNNQQEPCELDDIKKLTQTSKQYVEDIKANNTFFESFLNNNSNLVNHYEAMSDLYDFEVHFGNTEWFRSEKRKIIYQYVTRLRTGKITVNGDNLTIFGNPYALLLKSVGMDPKSDPTLNIESGTIQCYTKRFQDGEYLCGIRNPHNSPNNICYLHNMYSDEMQRYFVFSDNIMAVNCIHTDVQDRANGCDFDSDFFFVTNNEVMVKSAKAAYEQYPTIVNKLKESGLTYQNTMKEYARMDNKFAKSRIGIGESSNLAQLAMTYYWTNPSRELYDNFVILSVLAQVIIDGCKREYEVDAIEEIKRIKKLPCMQQFEEVEDELGNKKQVRRDFPEFMRFTRKIQYTKNGKEIERELVNQQKEKLSGRISSYYKCPMNSLQIALNEIKPISSKNTIPTEIFIKKVSGNPSRRQINKIISLISELDIYGKELSDDASENAINKYEEKFNEILNTVKGMRNINDKTFNRLIELAFDCDRGRGPKSQKTDLCKRNLIKILHAYDKERFLSNFKKWEEVDTVFQKKYA